MFCDGFGRKCRVEKCVVTQTILARSRRLSLLKKMCHCWANNGAFHVFSLCGTNTGHHRGKNGAFQVFLCVKNCFHCWGNCVLCVFCSKTMRHCWVHCGAIRVVVAVFAGPKTSLRRAEWRGRCNGLIWCVRTGHKTPLPLFELDGRGQSPRAFQI